MKFLVFIFLSTTMFSQNFIPGKILSENGFGLENVLVINIKTGSKVFTDNEGNFNIEVSLNDELRFIKQDFERVSKIIQIPDLITLLSIQLIKTPIEIEEVKVFIKPTGNLGKDVTRIKTDNSEKILKKNIGLPQPKGILRETIPTSLPKAIASLNIDAIYKIVSGKAEQMKKLYKYEDMQRNLNWIIESNGNEYFTERGIPNGKIREFIEFSILIEPKIEQNIRLNKLHTVNFLLEETATIYLERLMK